MDSKPKRNIHAGHRKRLKEKFQANGLESFAEHEVLELLLFFALPQGNVNPMAHNLISHFGSLKNVLDAPYENLLEVKGVKEHTATLLKFLPALLNYISQKQTQTAPVLSSFAASTVYCKLLFTGLTHEAVYILCLDADLRVKATKKIASGTTTRVGLNVGEITKYILNQGCSRIILAHNHPTGSSSPSAEDFTFTKKLFISLAINNVDIDDHIIIGKTDSHSMARAGELQEIKKLVFKSLGESNENPVFRKNCLD